MNSSKNFDAAKLIALTMVDGFGAVLCRRLLDRFGSAAQIWQAGADELLQVRGVAPRHVAAMTQLDWQAVAEIERDAAFCNAHIYGYGQALYPSSLSQLYDPPSLLFGLGDIQPCDRTAVAIVGTRRASPYALRQAEYFARKLAEMNVTVVSGLARGVDIVAHRAAIKAGGRTIAVLGSGVAKIYPAEHRRDVQNIMEHGAVLSEYAPHTRPAAHHFPCRNRIISGLSLGVIVVEAGRKSGALITAYAASDQGREVFALPGEISAGRFYGCHRLIQQGAKLIQDIEDVIEELSELQHLAAPPADDAMTRMSILEKKIWDALGEEPVVLDEIAERLTLPPGQICIALLHMEMKGLIAVYPGQQYSRNRF